MKHFWKNQRFQGFLMGALSCGLAVSLCGAAFAASRSISVSDGIQIVMNGQAFQPKDSKGAPVELFNYNGTVYAPVRALCQQAGMKVSYDSASKTVTVTSPSAPAGGQTAPSQTGKLTDEQARQRALDHAKLSANNVTFLKTELDTDDGRSVYEVEFVSGQTEYDYEIDAATGEILKNSQKNHPSAGVSDASGPVTEAKAREIALAKAPGASVIKCKRDREDGVEIFEIELRKGAVEYDCEIEIATGRILKWEEDRD